MFRFSPCAPYHLCLQIFPRVFAAEKEAQAARNLTIGTPCPTYIRTTRPSLDFCFHSSSITRSHPGHPAFGFRHSFRFPILGRTLPLTFCIYIHPHTHTPRTYSY
ncbi:hypothetical protein F5144DRAFT_362657 [Chaetomium tenue]|uniref:Uncharacterized protein n=1 Tax=Chaetomium tenue TaxID=1854479 RepID=A0ACB7NYE5_9PEZI|nr:hypothetical protein F5144DRAFT_362657 [Chaetomium globosum]